MTDLQKLALLIGLYGGLGILALLILLAGMLVAQRRSSVIAFASIAGVCVFLHATLLYFISDMSRAWSGGSNQDSILIASGGAIMLLGALAIPLFVSRKLARADSVGPADTSRAAAIVILIFLIVYIASSLLRSGPIMGPPVLLIPRFWLVIVVSGAAAWGLWRHTHWAWWLGFVGAAWELFRFVQNIVFNPSVAAFNVLSIFGFMALLQGIVVTLLLHKNSREACLR
jgi:hypothetical protein